MKINKENKITGKYVASGLIMTLSGMVSGFIVLRWILPENLGTWQSFTVFIGYFQLMSLGIPQGINRELPYWLGKDKIEIALKKLKTAGAFINGLSLFLFSLLLLVSMVLYFFDVLEIYTILMLCFAGFIALINIQKSFLGATYRTSKEFTKITKIQLVISVLYFILIPLIYFWEIWGYVIYQTLIALLFLAMFQLFRPFKIKYEFNKNEFLELFKVGFPIFFWNYVGVISRSLPRVILVFFGSPLLVGLFSPAANINNAILTLPKFLNRYLFPKLSFNYGRNDDKEQIIRLSIKVAVYLFFLMTVVAFVLIVLIKFVFPILFPKYVDGIFAAQIMVFSGVFYSVNTIFHNALNSIKVFKPFKFIMLFKMISLIILTFIFYNLLGDLLLGVSLGAALTELMNTFNYIYFLKSIERDEES